MQKTTFDDFEIIRTLGQGAFSTVFLVKRKKDNKQYALKSIKMENLSKIEQQNSVNEVRILSSIVHPNIISYKESFWNWNNKTLNIIMEYCDDGDLESKIKKMERNKIKFNENLIWNYAFQILFGIKALHDKGVIHRDIKSANIFLSKLNNKCKIGDLNTGKVIKKNKNKNNSNYQIGTPTYFSPEIWKKGEISYKSDIWAFGCIVYEMCSLKMPFKGKNMEELKKNICKGKIEKISSRYSKELWEFIQTLLQNDVEKRPDCEMILRNKIVKDKLNQLSGFNFMNEKNDDESSITDTIEYKNLWDLENKIPIKKKYTKTNMSYNVEETIRNDSSFSEISSLDLDLNINKEQKSVVQKKEYFKTYTKCHVKSNQNNILKKLREELILVNDNSKIKKHKSIDFQNNFNGKLKIEKFGIKKYKSFSYYINFRTKKKITKNKEDELFPKRYKSDLINIDINKKIMPKGTIKNRKISAEIEQKKYNLFKSTKFNQPKEQPNNKIKKETKKKNIILEEKSINFTTKKNEISKIQIKYNYTNYKNSKADNFSRVSCKINLKQNNNNLFPKLNLSYKTDKNISFNKSIQQNKIKKLETSYYKNKSQNKNKSKIDLIFEKKEKLFKKENIIRLNVKKTKTYINNGNNVNEDNSFTNKLNKKNINKCIKIIEIDLNPNNNKNKLKKSLDQVNPFNKILNKTFSNEISKKNKNIKKKNISISSKQVNNCIIKKSNI